ncbi:MAG: RagB/SusD family nutrient uptake outer membrane protein, partial [Odoribacter sp.]|nr:RagB/SusD family nutrient uptake outer membrane protein [Odoribacter sp.]
SAMYRFMAPHTPNEPDHLLYQMGLNQFDPAPTYVRKHVMDLYDKQADLRYLLCYGGVPPYPESEKGAEPFMNSYIAWNPGGMKLSEVYLMIAECYARQNNAGKAMEYLNLLREKRTLKAKYEEWTTEDAKVAFKWIREERKRELVLTCNGFFDMRRYAKQLNETWTKEYTTIGGEVKNYTLSPDSPLMIYPFPQNATETADLIQNTK